MAKCTLRVAMVTLGKSPPDTSPRVFTSYFLSCSFNGRHWIHCCLVGKQQREAWYFWLFFQVCVSPGPRLCVSALILSPHTSYPAATSSMGMHCLVPCLSLDNCKHLIPTLSRELTYLISHLYNEQVIKSQEVRIRWQDSHPEKELKWTFNERRATWKIHMRNHSWHRYLPGKHH